ncbi:hypothetical protein BD413DRAFT_567484 [Trametes elegans]|nr:hypothetical protein BD413DRAFT_567484 [Trametes elegans]
MLMGEAVHEMRWFYIRSNRCLAHARPAEGRGRLGLRERERELELDEPAGSPRGRDSQHSHPGSPARQLWVGGVDGRGAGAACAGARPPGGGNPGYKWVERRRVRRRRGAPPARAKAVPVMMMRTRWENLFGGQLAMSPSRQHWTWASDQTFGALSTAC